MSEILSDNPTTETPSVNRVEGPIGHEHQRLFYLHDLPDFKVHHDDPDIRGWSVKLADGTTVGKVENLIVDKGDRKVRYVEVTGDRGFFADYQRDDYYLDRDADTVFGADDDSHFIVPIAMIRLDRSDNDCYIESVGRDVVGSVPRYRRGSSIRPSYEVSTLRHYSTGDHEYAAGFDERRYRDLEDGPYRSLDDHFYTSGYFNEGRFYDRHAESITSKGL